MLRKIVTELKLGEFLSEPQRVYGGYMHKMYKLETSTGIYAVKLLNPAIMKRQDALNNFKRAEFLEEKLEEQGIPVVPAIRFRGEKMQCIEEQYFYVFQWIDGIKLNWNKIEKVHCHTVGKLLAKIHKIESVSGRYAEIVNFDWDAYIQLSKVNCIEITQVLELNRDLLYEAMDEYNRAIKNLPDCSCITDGDLDCKNILWLNGNPLIIDLESLDYGNSLLDMYRLALSWSGDVLSDINYNYLAEFIKAYLKEFGSVNIDWNLLYGIGFSWIEWLEYNIRRALMLESDSEEERQLGIQQVKETIPRIKYYASIKEELIGYLESICRKM